MDVAARAPQVPVGGWSSGPPQKFGHGSLFDVQLQSRKPVLQNKIGVNPLKQAKVS